MAKTIRPTKEETEIIRGIFESPEDYSVVFETGEIFYRGAPKGEIRRKFIPFGYQYKHYIINAQKRDHGEDFRCPLANNCERYRSRLDSPKVISFDKIIAEVRRVQ